MTRWYRFRDLQEIGLVRNWPQLRRLQAEENFPLGVMLSANCRAWSEEDLDAWIKSRPIENHKLQGAAKLRRERRLAAQRASQLLKD